MPMAVDSNFERLEQEVNRLVEVLGTLRQENADLKERVQGLEGEISIVSAENERLKKIESEHQHKSKTVGKSRRRSQGRGNYCGWAIDALWRISIGKKRLCRIYAIERIQF